MKEPLTHPFPIRLNQAMKTSLDYMANVTGFRRAQLIRHGLTQMLREFHKTGAIRTDRLQEIEDIGGEK